MNPLNVNSLAGVVLFARLFGRASALRALTLSQSTIKGLPGRANKDVAEIQAQSTQAAEQIVQLAEAIFDANWQDPDVEAQDDAQATVDALTAAVKAHD